MLNVRPALLAICILLAAFLPAWSQEPPPTVQSLEAEIVEWRRVATALGTELQNLQSEQDPGSFEARKSYNASLVDHYAYQAELRDHARDVLGWQLFSAYILLALVAVVATLGVVLSFLEVRSGLVTSRLAPALAQTLSNATAPVAPADGGKVVGAAVDPVVVKEPAPSQVVDHRHSIIVTATSLQVTSAITGVIILVISLGFLYLFVDKVLELKPVDLITQNGPSALPETDAPATK